MKHSIIFIRNDGFGNISNIAVCEFESQFANGKEALKQATTEWINDTQEGHDAYEGSCEDFNIGDLACNQSAGLLNRYGIQRLKIKTMSGNDYWEHFDTHLYEDFDKHLRED